MSITILVLCEDGQRRAFHQSGVRSANGYVYANGKRVYGTRTFPIALGASASFTASGKHAWLAQPVPAFAGAGVS